MRNCGANLDPWLEYNGSARRRTSNSLLSDLNGDKRQDLMLLGGDVALLGASCCQVETGALLFWHPRPSHTAQFPGPMTASGPIRDGKLDLTGQAREHSSILDDLRILHLPFDVDGGSPVQPPLPDRSMIQENIIKRISILLSQLGLAVSCPDYALP